MEEDEVVCEVIRLREVLNFVEDVGLNIEFDGCW